MVEVYKQASERGEVKETRMALGCVDLNLLSCVTWSKNVNFLCLHVHFRREGSKILPTPQGCCGN